MPATKKPDTVHDEPNAEMPRHKPEYWDLCNICKPRYVRNQHITSFHQSLKQFGYTNLTRDETAEAYDKAVAGPITDADIIAMFIRRELEKNGLVSRD